MPRPEVPAPPLTDAQSQAVSRAYLQYHRLVRRWIGAAGLSDQEEAAAYVWYRLVRGVALGTTDPDRLTPQLLRTLARDAICEHRRRATRDYERLELLATAPREGSDNEAGSAIDMPAVLEAIDGLPRRDRAALLSHYRDGVRFPEIARDQGCTGEAVRQRTHRSLAKVRAALRLSA